MIAEASREFWVSAGNFGFTVYQHVAADFNRLSRQTDGWEYHFQSPLIITLILFLYEFPNMFFYFPLIVFLFPISKPLKQICIFFPFRPYIHRCPNFFKIIPVMLSNFFLSSPCHFSFFSISTDFKGKYVLRIFTTILFFTCSLQSTTTLMVSLVFFVILSES